MLGVNSQFQNVVFAMPKQSQSPEPDPDLIEIPEESAPDFGMEMAWMSVADSTRKQYQSALRHLDRWLEETGRELTDVTLSRYLLLRHNGQITIHRRYRKANGKYRLAKLRRKASPPTLKNVVLAARFRAIAMDQPIPTGRHVKNAMKKISAKGRGRGRGQAPGLRESQLEQLVSACDAAFSLWGLRDAAMFYAAFDGGLRVGEIAALQVQDVDFRPEGHARITIRSSKTDQAGVGAVQIVRSRTAKRIQRWMDVAGIDDGPLFRKVINGGVQPDGLRTNQIQLQIKKWAKKAGLPSPGRVRFHGLRRGLAMELTASGMPLQRVQRILRWKSASMCAHYVGTEDSERDGILQYLDKRPQLRSVKSA